MTTTTHGTVDEQIDYYLRTYAPDRAPADLAKNPDPEPARPSTPDPLSLSAGPSTRRLVLRAGYAEVNGTIVRLSNDYEATDSDPNIVIF